MSGGSFNYLCYNIEDNPLDSIVVDNIDDMANWLSDNGKHEASAELVDLHRYLTNIKQEVYRKAATLIDVMRAAEWWCSGDSGEDDFDSVYATHKANSEETTNSLKIIKKPYRVVRNYGCYEGWDFDKEEYQTAEEALNAAMADNYTTNEFAIIKIIEFKEMQD